VSRINLTQYFPFLNRKNSSLPRGEMLALRPLRTREIAWTMKPEDETPGAQLTVPRRDDKIGQILSRVFQIPATKTIELDEFGAAVWEKCDGQHSVEQLIVFTGSAYKLNRRQAEVSVVAFMRMLAQRRLIGLNKNTTDKNSNRAAGKGTAHVHRSDRPRAQARRRRRH
jgi:hypothetical protein